MSAGEPTRGPHRMTRCAAFRTIMRAWRTLFARECGPFLRSVLLVVAMASALPSAAGAASERLCEGSPSLPFTNAGAELGSAGRSVEAQLETAADRVSAADQAVATLSAVAATASGGSPANLADYCLAAGEAYRLSRNGNPFQARELLMDAFRFANAANASAQSALAAYRLSLVSREIGTADGGGRGIRRAMQPPIVRAAASGEGSSQCDLLTNPATDDAGAVFMEVASLGCATERAQAGKDDELFARASLRLARLWLDAANRNQAQGAKAKASAIALDALDAAMRVGSVALRGELTSRLADVALDAGAGRDPRLLTVATRLIATPDASPSVHAIAEAMTGRIAFARGWLGAAAEHFQRAIFLESQSPLPLRLPDWYLLLASADSKHRDQDTALAFRALTMTRPLLPAYDQLTEEANFSLRLQPVFEATVDSLLDATQGDDLARIATVQTVVESYRQAELQSLFGSECVAARNPIRPAELKPGEVLLYPILLPDRVELIYAMGDANGRAQYHRLPTQNGISRSEVIALVDGMTDLTSEAPADRGDRRDAWRSAAAKLYTVLIQPISDKLGNNSTLIIVPDGRLAALPFGALIAADGHFLIEKSRVAVVPALAYAQPGATPGHPLSVVAATLSKEVDFPFGTFPKLTGTASEAQAALGISSAHHGLLIQNFHRVDLEAALARRDVDVLHLATHASFNGRSDRSYIVGDGELIPISDLREMIARNQTRGDQLDLVVLSACETAVGDDQASMGLAGTAVQSGARSALASLWEVDDAGTAALMKNFYANYGAGEGKAEALHNAQIALLGKGGNFADPNVWAAFTLLGGWR